MSLDEHKPKNYRRAWKGGVNLMKETATPRTDALTEPEMDMDGNRLLVRYDQLARLSRQLEIDLAATAVRLEKAHECARAGADILLALVVLKAYKDAYGKTEYYEATQPAGWEIARAFLTKTMPDEYEVSLRALDLRDGS